MELLKVDDNLTKATWQEIAKRTKNGGIVAIHPVKLQSRDGSIIGIYQAIVGYKPMQHLLDFNEYHLIGDAVRGKVRGKGVSDVTVLGNPIFVTQNDYVQGVKATGSKAVAKVTEYYYAQLNQQVHMNKLKHVLVTEEGILGILGDIIQKISRKVARDTFEISYSTYIEGEMRVTNKTLTKTHPNNLMYSHTVCIGVEVYDSVLAIAIMYGDDTESGVNGGQTHFTDSINLDRIPLIQFKQGTYFGEAYKVLFDVAVRAMILSSSEGYKDYVKENGTPYVGDTTEYSWLTLKDGSKVTWDNYNMRAVADLVGKLGK